MMMLSLLLTLPMLQELGTPSLDRSPAPPDRLPTLSVADLVLKPYRPRYVSAPDLAVGVQATLGRSFFVTEHGGSAGRIVTNTTLMGGLLLVFDEPSYVESLLAMCAEIDKAPERSIEVNGSLTYRTRFISLERAEDTVRMMRLDLDFNADKQGGLLFARGRTDSLAELEAILEEIDVPDPRVMVTCYLLKGGLGEESKPSPLLPVDLVTDLKKLLPQFGFKCAGFAMLQSSIAPERSIRLVVSTDLDDDYQLEFRVAAYDPEAGKLTAERCQLMRQGQGGPVQMFSTDTVLSAGEYTVLGATGAEPILLVVRLEKL